ncbi:MAG TPA: hypothetical protein VGA52_14060 [Anaerolineales bacterium]
MPPVTIAMRLPVVMKSLPHFALQDGKIIQYRLGPAEVLAGDCLVSIGAILALSDSEAEKQREDDLDQYLLHKVPVACTSERVRHGCATDTGH